jgi:hypothetical protein
MKIPQMKLSTDILDSLLTVHLSITLFFIFYYIINANLQSTPRAAIGKCAKGA